MALILEVMHPDGTRTWQRLESLPVTIGRALANDLILDDPYVDARHARIALEPGGLQLHDLGSVNGVVSDGLRTRTPVSLWAGMEVRLGRTRLRFRDSEEAVAPALVDEPAHVAASNSPAVVAPSPFRGVPTWATTRNGQLLLAGAAVVLFGTWSWLTSFGRSDAGDVVTGITGFVVAAAIWAGLWAVASRATVRRFNYLAHFAVVAAIAIAGLVWSFAEEWLAFFFPDAAALEVVSTLVLIVVLCALIAGHLALASSMPGGRRWRLGLVITGSALGLLGLAALASSEEFTDVPTFSETLKPVRGDLIPALTLEGFGAELVDLKRDVDEMAKRDRKE